MGYTQITEKNSEAVLSQLMSYCSSAARKEQSERQFILRPARWENLQGRLMVVQG